MTYDSRTDTLMHIQVVQAALHKAIVLLGRRQLNHDQSKLDSPEREVFDEWAPKLSQLEYGTPEYAAAVAEMGPALAHHYALNQHHPEHWGGGIADMSLIDLIEMLCDWWAAGQRQATNAGLLRSIELNQQRFGYSDELKRILTATAVQMGLVEEAM